MKKLLWLMFLGIPSINAQVFEGMNDSVLKAQKVLSIQEIDEDNNKVLKEVIYDSTFQEKSRRAIDRIAKYEYTASGKVALQKNYDYNTNELEVLIVNDYDARDNRISSKYYNQENTAKLKPFRSKFFEYDLQGTVVSEKLFSNDSLSADITYRNQYANGKLIKHTAYIQSTNDSIVQKFEYNSEGKKTQIENFTQGIVVSKSEIQNNQWNDLIWQKEYLLGANGSLYLLEFVEVIHNHKNERVSENTKEYDESGVVKKELESRFHYKDGLLVVRRTGVNYFYQYTFLR